MELQIDDLQNLCKAIGNIKSQQVEDLPHYANQALFFQNDAITTGILNNKTEIKIHLLTNQLIYSDNEENHFIDLNSDSVFFHLKEILRKYHLEIPKTEIKPIEKDQLSKFHEYATGANRLLELFRMSLNGKFTMVHLWTHHFDFSVEWFTGNEGEQIGIGISPGDEQNAYPYFYVSLSPFNGKIVGHKLPVGLWNTVNWNGIRVELKDLLAYPDKGLAEIKELFLIAKRNFDEFL